MPGNEVGDKVHNFFDQDLSHRQHQLQVGDGNQLLLNSNPWVGNQGQVGSPLISSFKNFSVQQSDFERGHVGQSLRVPNGLAFTQSTSQPGSAINEHQYMYAHQAFQGKQNEANFMGVDRELDQQNTVNRGPFNPQMMQGNFPEHLKASMRSEAGDSPVKIDFLGGQQLMSTQQLNMLQSLSRQQPGFSDMQLLQQQTYLRKMQELHMQQQFQQQEFMQSNAGNQASATGKHLSKNHPSSQLSGTSVRDASPNQAWMPEPVAGNTVRLHHDTPPSVHAISNRPIFSEQSQVLHMMGMVPQQGNQSLYGVPVANTRGTLSQHSRDHFEKTSLQQAAAHSSPYTNNQHTVFPGHVGIHEHSSASRFGSQGTHTLGQSSQSRVMEDVQPVEVLHGTAAMNEYQEKVEVSNASRTPASTAASSTVVPLDPTEEKILFGTDDNIWDVFSKSINVSNGSYNEGTECPVQSGSWSALMQSAVAETSSGETRLHEEWSGLSFPSNEPSAGNHQSSAFSDIGKQKINWADGNLETAASLRSIHSPLGGSDNKGMNYGVPGTLHSAIKSSFVQNDKLESGSPHSSIHHSGEESNKGSAQLFPTKTLAEGSHIYGHSGHLPGTEINAKLVAGSLIHQKGVSSFSTSGQSSISPNAWNYMQNVTSGEDSTTRISGYEFPPRRGKGNENKMDMNEGLRMGQGTSAWKAISVPRSAAQFEHIKADSGTPYLNQDSMMSNVPTTQRESSADGNQEVSQHLPSIHHRNFWKQVGSVGDSKGAKGEFVGKNHHHQNTHPQVVESFVTNSEKGAHNMFEMNNSDRDVDASRNYHSNLSHPSSSGLRKNVWLDANNSRITDGAKQNSFSHIGQKSSGPPKFQYHPMGDLDEDAEAYYGMKNVTNSQNSFHQGFRALKGHDQGSKSSSVSQLPNSSTEMGKVQVPDSHGHGERSRLDEVSLRGNVSGQLPNTSNTFDRSNGGYALNNSFNSSQNMLELLHKVDQSNQSSVSEMSERENSDGSIGHYQRNQSSTSSFGLQLAPPSQGLVVQNQTSSPRSTAQTMSPFSLNLVASETEEKVHSWPASAVSQLGRHCLDGSQGESENNRSNPLGETGKPVTQYNNQRNLSAGFSPENSNSRSQLMTMTGAQLTRNQSMRSSHNRPASRFRHVDSPSESDSRGQSLDGPLLDTHPKHENFASPTSATEPSISNQSSVAAPMQQIQVLVSEPSETSTMFIQGGSSMVSPNMWANVPSQHGFLGVLAHKETSASFSSQPLSNSHFNSIAPQKSFNQDTQRGNAPSVSDCATKSQDFPCRDELIVKESSWQQVPSENSVQVRAPSVLQGKEVVVGHQTDGPLPDTAVTQRDIEAFGRSLKPDSGLHDSYSLLNQLHSMKKPESDIHNRESKRLKGLGSSLDDQQITPFEPAHQLSHEYNSLVRNASASCSTAVSSDPKLKGLSLKHGDNQDRNTSHNGNLHSQELLAVARNYSYNHSSNGSTISMQSEHSQINPQMAPSWFNHYGSLKNGQMFPVYDPQKSSTLITGESPSLIGNSSNSFQANDQTVQVRADADTCPGDNVDESSTIISNANKHLTSFQVLPPVADQLLVPLREKKRKTATSDLLPWHTEVSEGGLKAVENIRVAEAEWARVARRVVEKVDDEVEFHEDGTLILRPKRRLILTTQLIQQLLRPPPASVLTADVSSSVDHVAYLVGRASVGDACRFFGREKCIPLGNGKILSDEHEASGASDDQYTKATENFTSRAAVLEKEFLRLEKKGSFLDLRAESQDLDKFSMINRFAKFHSRGQTDGSDVSTSSDRNAISQRVFPQRYVTAHPVPRNLPDRVQCLSL